MKLCYEIANKLFLNYNKQKVFFEAVVLANKIIVASYF